MNNNGVPLGLSCIIATGGAIQNNSLVAGVIVAILLFIYITLTLFTIKNRSKLIEEDKEAYKASEQRLSNPDYALALKNAGFNVPEKYL